MHCGWDRPLGPSGVASEVLFLDLNGATKAFVKFTKFFCPCPFLNRKSVLFSNKAVLRGFPGGSVVKNPLTKQETWVRPLGREDPPEEEMATHSSIPAWEIPRTEEPAGLYGPCGRKESDMT